MRLDMGAPCRFAQVRGGGQIVAERPFDRPRLYWNNRMAELETVTHGKPATWTGTGWTGSAVKLADTVFVGSVGVVVYAYEAPSSRVRWIHKGERMFKSSPCLYDNKLYVGNVDDLLRCIDAATGKLVWSFDTTRDLDSSPCVVDGRVVFGSRDGNLYMLDAASGREVWRQPLDGRIISSPCIVGGHIWIGTATGWVYCFGP